MDRRSRRQRARQLKTELVAAYAGDGRDRSLAQVRHLLPSANHNGSSEVSCYHVVDWIEDDPALLWEPFAAGSTVLHWATQHLRFEQINHRTNTANVWKSVTTVISDPWTWLLQLVATHNPAMLTQQRDGGGDSCLDVFQSAWIHGARRNDSYQFASAVDAIRQQPHLLDQLKRMVELETKSSSSLSKPLGRAGDRRVMLVCKVWKAWRGLCEAANTHPESMMTLLARTGRAMEPFAWLSVTLCPSECQQPNVDGDLPLHSWASSPAVATEEMDGLLGHLLQAHPQAVTVPDADGRLPLHRALYRANKPLLQAQTLALACPETLGSPDPQNEICLYPFAMAAQAARLEVRAVMRATQRRHPSQRLYDWLDTCRRDMDTYEQEVSTALLGHVYVMLRALPQALEYNRQVATQEVEREQKAQQAASQTRATANVGTTVKDAYSKVLHDLV